MNTEKELLLALLIEKYAKQQNKTGEIPKAAKPAVRYKRGTRGKTHKWTQDEKDYAVSLYKEGHSITSIAASLNLRTKQVDNMVYSLLRREIKT